MFVECGTSMLQRKIFMVSFSSFFSTFSTISFSIKFPPKSYTHLPIQSGFWFIFFNGSGWRSSLFDYCNEKKKCIRSTVPSSAMRRTTFFRVNVWRRVFSFPVLLLTNIFLNKSPVQCNLQFSLKNRPQVRMCYISSAYDSRFWHVFSLDRILFFFFLQLYSCVNVLWCAKPTL